MIRFQSVLVATGHDEEGVLAFDGDRLVAVLTRLGLDTEIAPGCWFVECRFQSGASVDHPTFPDLDAVSAWLEGK